MFYAITTKIGGKGIYCCILVFKNQQYDKDVKVKKGIGMEYFCGQNL